MPDLPTLTVTQAQQDGILAAYKAKYAANTAAETVAAYKAELAARIKKVVLEFEKQSIDTTAFNQKAALASEIDTGLIPPQ